MADRCVSGEFDGSARRAAKDPECVRLEIDEAAIRYHMNKINPIAAAARAADRARIATETAVAEAAQAPIKFIFVERAGSAPAAAAVEAKISVIESQIGLRIKRSANLARSDAAAHAPTPPPVRP